MMGELTEEARMSRTNVGQSVSYRGRGKEAREVCIPPTELAGILQMPKNTYALVVFAHGSGSSRLSPRNVQVARALNDRGIATLLFDLLAPVEEGDRVNVFNIPLLASRLVVGSTLNRQSQGCRLGCSAPAPGRRRR
jgi:hypothetical protein